MVLALVVAILAVALGLGLGLAPGARRHALGPLRTMALTAVVAVIAVHLLPEALSELGWIGVGLFAFALGLPRWLRLLGRARLAPPAGEHFGLELGFWGLVVHHVGDGLALGAYAPAGERDGAHGDVLVALVLHTVPLVAVISAAYARAWGVKSAVLRSAALALASSIGVLAANLPPPELVERGQAWIAAAVAGLLLHGIAHDLSEDLPTTRTSRVLDLAAALFGGGFGWLSAALDHHPGGEFSTPLSVSFAQAVERTALPLLLGLLLAAALASRLGAQRGLAGGFRDSAFRAGIGVESFFIGCAQIGGALTLAAHALAAVVLARGTGPKTAPEPARRTFLGCLEQRLDWIGVWVVSALVLSVVLDASVPPTALAGLNEWVLLGAVAWLGVGLPVPAVAAVVVGNALSSKGLPGAPILLLAAWPPTVRAIGGFRVFLVLPALVFASVALGRAFEPVGLSLAPGLSWAAAAVLFALVLTRVYRLGLRGWLAALAPSEPLTDLERQR